MERCCSVLSMTKAITPQRLYSKFAMKAQSVQVAHHSCTPSQLLTSRYALSIHNRGPIHGREVGSRSSANGLYITRRKRRSQKLEWADIGAATERVCSIIQGHIPLTWNFFTRIATPKLPKSQTNMRCLVDSIVRFKVVIGCDHQS